MTTEITHHAARVNGVKLHYLTAGSGEPLYLLHGYPQTCHLWRKMVPLLSEHFRLVMPDLRGYGDSEKPLDGYDKRTMAGDIRELARHLGHERFGLVGHDRGGRVSHRYALDHGETLSGLMLLDIEPTKTKFDRIDRQIAMASWHWLFLPVPDVAETLIAAEPETFLRYLVRSWVGNPAAVEEYAMQEYLRAFKLPGTIRATCAEYRAGATVDLEHDAADEDQRIEVPLNVLWGGLGKRQGTWDMLAVWREKARSVEGRAIADSGHFIPEETPEELAREILTFFGKLIS